MMRDENGIINLFTELQCARPPDNCIGIGDDAAVIPLSDTRLQLVTTDVLTSGVHFLLEKAPPDDLGYKSLAVNVSDIAAMGGTPTYAFLSIALPANLAQSDWIASFSRGLAEAADTYGVTLLGGDTTRSTSDVFINITLLGAVDTASLKRRSNGMPGDQLCVTGYLGDARAGLSIILEDLALDQTSAGTTLVRRHYRPTAHVRQGVVLGASPFVRCMMDLSDGLVADGKKLTRASGCGAKIDLDALPCSEELVEWCKEHGRSHCEYAAIGGEDYVLLFSVDPAKVDDLRSVFSSHSLRQFSVIGELTRDTQTIFTRAGQVVAFDTEAFKHF